MKIRNIISNLLIIFIIIILLNISYSKFILKDDIIKIFGKSFLIVMTGSMEPEIATGELVIISEQDEYKIGDIVTYKDNEDYIITHRIINIDSNNFTAKGDANNLEDELQAITYIEGKVICHSKLLGFFVLYILKPLVIIYVILFVIINLFFYKKEKNENEELENKESKIKNEENSNSENIT